MGASVAAGETNVEAVSVADGGRASGVVAFAVAGDGGVVAPWQPTTDEKSAVSSKETAIGVLILLLITVACSDLALLCRNQINAR